MSNSEAGKPWKTSEVLKSLAALLRNSRDWVWPPAVLGASLTSNMPEISVHIIYKVTQASRGFRFTFNSRALVKKIHVLCVLDASQIE